MTATTRGALLTIIVVGGIAILVFCAVFIERQLGMPDPIIISWEAGASTQSKCVPLSTSYDFQGHPGYETLIFADEKCQSGMRIDIVKKNTP